MRVFHCNHCGQLIFFENTTCGNCGHRLSYLPDLQIVASLAPLPSQPAGVGGTARELWSSPAAGAEGKTYRLCENYRKHNVCNWAISADDPGSYCQSCQFTRVIPDLSRPENQNRWCRLETAKRRLIYSLIELKLPLCNKAEDPIAGLEFLFVGDLDDTTRVLTGHENGVITMNIAEADDVERERRRVSMHEPYRTLLGHFRHEIGHYYWDRLLKDKPRLNAFREQFGDEQEDYSHALQNYYRTGAKANWQQYFVSAYATSHPWEDWAETWAHYLHINDALEIAQVCGLSLQPMCMGEPAMKTLGPKSGYLSSFDEIVDNWFPLTYVLNSLNRSMGLPDAYPFVLSPATVEKLRFVHETIHECGRGKG